MNVEKIKAVVRDVPDFPKPGIIYKDITPILQDGEIFSALINYLADPYRNNMPKYVAGIESRGFIFGAALAAELGCGFIPVRKAGKLPYKTIRQSYSLEYGEATIEMHEDAAAAGDKIVLIDDLLATGGTAQAAISLLRKLNVEIIGVEFIIELAFLNGRDVLKPYPVRSLIIEK
ncbi:MAG: adenine phosphoribosyltransferase [Victivallaceae bacterium]